MRSRRIQERIESGELTHPISDYEARLKREIDIIKTWVFPATSSSSGISFASPGNKGIPVGPGRGSAAGSLVAFSLRITNVDPLEHDLIFERFLNPERVSMPDIDIDFCEARRGEVIDYVTAEVRPGKRGSNHHLRDHEGQGRHSRRGARARHLLTPMSIASPRWFRRLSMPRSTKHSRKSRSSKKRWMNDPRMKKSHRDRQTAGRREPSRLDPCRRSRDCTRSHSPSFCRSIVGAEVKSRPSTT